MCAGSLFDTVAKFNVESVSYTHLDVYKRQAIGFFPEIFQAKTGAFKEGN